MALLPTLLAVLASLTAAGPSAPDGGAPDVAGELARLSAPESARRAAAERWLASHLAASDAALVERTLRAGDAEVRRRLERVLAADDRHLDLALSLFRSGDPALAAAGRGALALSLERWNPALVATGPMRLPAPNGESRYRDDVAELLGELRLQGPPEVLVLDLSRPLEENLGLLRRQAPLPLALVLAPGFAGREPHPHGAARVPRLARGAWDHLLLRLADVHGACLHAAGLRRDRPGGFLEVAPRAAPERSGIDHVLDWIRRAEGVEPDAAGAVRALVDCGWPGYLAVIAARWQGGQGREQDDVALTGLTRALAAGRLEPRFATERSLRALVAAAPRWLAAGTPEGRRRGHLATLALGRFGPTLAGGVSTLTPLLEGWERAGRAGRWVRLVALESLGVRSPGAAERAASVLARPVGRVTADLRRQALRAWLRTTPEPDLAPRVEGVEELVAACRDLPEARELARLLARAGLAPPRELEDPARIPASWGATARLALLAAWQARGELLPAARHALAWLRWPGGGDGRARGERLADLLAPSPAGADRPALTALLDRAGSLALGADEARAVERVALLAGLLPAERAAALLETTVRDGDWKGAGLDLALLGAVAGLPGAQVGEGARQTLAALFEAAVQAGGPDPPRDLMAALERALGGLFAGGDDGNAELLLRRLQRTLFKARSGWAAELPRYEWPPPPGVGWVELARRERRYGS